MLKHMNDAGFHFEAYKQDDKDQAFITAFPKQSSLPSIRLILVDPI